MAQYVMPLNFTQLLFIYESENNNREITALVSREILAFQEILNQFCHLAIDNYEYEYIRGILLFRTTNSPATDDPAASSLGNGSPSTSSTSSETRSLIEKSRVAILHDENRVALITYISRRHLTDPMRFQTVMSVLSLMSKVSTFAIEELFFRKSIGDVTIVKLISDMYKKNKI